MSNAHDQARSIPLTAGDLAEFATEVQERFQRMENVIGRTLQALDEYPNRISQHLDERDRQNESDRELAHSIRADFERLAQDPAHSWLKDHPMKRDLALMTWVQNSDLSFDEVVSRLESELFNALVAEGVPPAEAEKAASDAAETVGDKIAGGLSDPGDYQRQEAADQEHVMKHGKLVAKGILSKLRDKVAPGANSPGSGSPLTRDVERGGKPVVRTSRAGSESGSARPPKGIAPGLLQRLDRRSK